MEKIAMNIEETAIILKLLSDKTRLTMLKLLETNACCVCEFVDIFQMSQPAISQHLRKLRDAGIVREERKGQWIFYALNNDHFANQLIMLILAEMETQDDKIQQLIESGKRINCDQ
ncbi:ArsR/SmtB family transcription factor [Amphibacillus cookii]|uniref:ArsR/SmtB family transcription factor n=1 Tax=Amphibacillus cookii TaxID=767787 RepID=UPI00195F1536|nr:metalloregulator ArsR/SmtB family transcription factor [Amphibacillus cookii]MBM7539943.1 ArsR family transcriptional regulator [Amphibacillus cookii]